MGRDSRRGLATLVLLALAATFAGPVHGVASAVVGPIQLAVSRAQPDLAAEEPSPDATPQPVESPSETDESPGDGGEAAASSHGCGEDVDPAALAACATEAAADCAGQTEPPPACAEDVTQAATEAAEGLPPGGEEPPACEGSEPQEQLACAVAQVREQCPDDSACAPVDLVQACLEGDAACAPPDVLAEAAAAVCGAVEEESGGEGEPGEEPDCEEGLATCDTAPEGDECQEGLEYVQTRLRETACEPGAAACAVLAQVEQLLTCEVPAGCFQAVWDNAAAPICGMVDEDDVEGCETTLRTCDDPRAQNDCAEATAYLQGRAEAGACTAEDAVCAVRAVADKCGSTRDENCETAVFAAVKSLACAPGASGCPPEPVPSMRDCLSWNGTSPTPDVECVRKAVVAAVCATQGPSCVLTHPAVESLFSLPQACTTPTGEPCQKGLQALFVAALCAHTAACFPAWAQEAAKCKGASDLGCHALGLLHEACRGRACPPELTSLESCVAGAATQKCGDKDLQTFMRGWIADQCFAKGGASTACPRQVEIRRPRVLADPPAVDGVGDPAAVSEPDNIPQLQNGSTTFPFLSIANAMSALRSPQAQHLGLRGLLNIGAGTYREGLAISASEAAGLALDITTPGNELPVIAPASGPGLSLAPGHRVRIVDPVTIVGGTNAQSIAGPVSSVTMSLGSDRVYVDDWNLITAGYGIATVATPEDVRVDLAVEGAAWGVKVERAVDGGWIDVPLANGRATLVTRSAGTFDGTERVRIASAQPAGMSLSTRLVGVKTGVVYKEASGTFHVVTPQAPPTPPPSVPRTPETELPPAVRIAGEDRSATAAAVSRASFPDGAEQVFVATGQSFADALAAGPAASRSASPVVLVERDRIPDATHAEIERLKPTGVRLMGGTAAIGEQVEAQLKAMGVEVARLRGADRYATAAAVSAAHFTPGVPVAYVAGGEGFADALSGGAAAAALGGPVLLVQRDDLPSSTAEELRRLRPGRVVVLGGRQAVSDEVAEGLREFAGDVRRVSGPTRYATSAAVSRDAFAVTGGTVYVATGATFPDALAGVPAAGAQRAPLMLVEPDRLPPEIAAELDRLAPRRIVILGGERSVTQRLERELRSYQVP